MLKFHVVDGAGLIFDSFGHIGAALGWFAYRPLGRGAASYLAAKFRTSLGKKIGKDVIRPFASGAVDDFDRQRRQGHTSVESDDLWSIPGFDMAEKNLRQQVA